MTDISKLLDIMAALRSPGTGCPWDLAQDFSSVAPYTVEEAYEVADAIDRDDLLGLRDELGDLLFQVVFHARMAEEADQFDFAAVVEAICDKMERRHPHVFGSDTERQRGAVPGSWEDIKSTERSESSQADDSAMQGVANALPALKRAQKLGKRAARVGFDWPDQSGVNAKIAEELDELREAVASGHKEAVQAELGDVLFTVVNLARHLDVDAEQALAGANKRFEQRFRVLEASIRADNKTIEEFGIDALERRWQAAKKTLAGRS